MVDENGAKEHRGSGLALTARVVIDLEARKSDILRSSNGLGRVERLSYSVRRVTNYEVKAVVMVSFVLVAGYVRRTLSGCRIRRIDAQFTSP